MEIKMNIGIIALSWCLIQGCGMDIDVPNYSEKIKGDWVCQDPAHPKIFASFEDSLSSFLHAYGNDVPYHVGGDTLYVLGGMAAAHFSILKLTDEDLELALQGAIAKSYYRSKGLDTIRFKRLKAVNELRFERLGFYSSHCFGTCPAMNLEVDSLGNLLFHGQAYTGKDGGYAGRISPRELDVLHQKIHAIHWDDLADRYSVGWTDDQTVGLRIQVDGKVYESHAYGFGEEPLALRILYRKLMNLYQQAELQVDSTVLKQFQFRDLMMNGIPPRRH
jgi:hypothetical protein